jgi:hypothetical protein
MQSMYKPITFSSKLTDSMKPNATSFLDKIKRVYTFLCLIICFTLSLASSIGFPSISCLSTCLSFISLHQFSLRLQLLFNLELHIEVRNLNTCFKNVLIEYHAVSSRAVLSNKKKSISSHFSSIRHHMEHTHA